MRRYLEALSTVDIRFSLDPDADVDIKLSDLSFCAMESSHVADWLSSDALVSPCNSSSVAVRRLEEDSRTIRFVVDALQSTDVTFFVEYRAEAEAAADANAQAAVPLRVSLNMSLLLFDLNAADDFFAGSFIRDLDLFESTRTALILNNPSSKRAIDVSVRFTPRQLPWVLLFIIGQCVILISAWIALRLLTTRWAAQIAALRDHRDT